MEPGRWSSDDMTDLERQLLEAARGDRVPQELSARMAEALQSGGAAAAGGGAATALGTTLFGKTGLWGALSLGLMAGATAWYAAQPESAERRPAPAVAPESSEVARTDPASASVDAPAEVIASAEGDGRAPEGEPAAVDDRALRAEVALLARVRGALKQRSSARALALLERHRKRFASGTLRPEAAALRIEALIQQGDYAQAAAQGQRFARAHPNHPLRAHVTDLVAALPGADAHDRAR